MLQTDQYQSLILLKAASIIITKRREAERMCGYPEDYGGDADLLKRIDEFLCDGYIKIELDEAMKLLKGLKDSEA